VCFGRRYSVYGGLFEQALYGMLFPPNWNDLTTALDPKSLQLRFRRVENYAGKSAWLKYSG
jgi:hypothetical protein